MRKVGEIDPEWRGSNNVASWQWTLGLHSLYCYLTSGSTVLSLELGLRFLWVIQ